MVKIDQFYVEFDQKWSVYHRGETVRGLVHLKLNESVVCDGVQALFYGSARVFWTEQEPKDGRFRTVTFYQEKVYFNRTETILHLEAAKSAEKRCLQAGQHSIPFEFALPDKDLPTSFDAKHAFGYVRYFVKVSLMHNDRQKHSRKAFFCVVRETDLNAVAACRSWLTKEARVQLVSNGCFVGAAAGGELSMFLNMPKSGYVPGEPIAVSVELENHSTVSVRSMRLSLRQHVTCYADQPESKMRDGWSMVVAAVREVRVRRGQSHLLENEMIYIPAVVPTFVEFGLLEVEYSLMVEAFAKSKSALLSLSTPIYIGTVPVSVDSALHADYAPPSYEQSTLGLSPSCSDRSEEDAYLPLYAVYRPLLCEVSR